ncbi:L-aspartate oxidase chloroplastic [Zea mays]|uniref:L-aspartate oxidase chloroplastic n=1 Tax=Zea mays TaxID=4577 RepID=A0A1D6GZT6_MAIZE|nr:L-aspartate oxidase chloroplastic [Zea mays]
MELQSVMWEYVGIVRSTGRLKQGWASRSARCATSSAAPSSSSGARWPGARAAACTSPRTSRTWRRAGGSLRSSSRPPCRSSRGAPSRCRGSCKQMTMHAVHPAGPWGFVNSFINF